MPKAALKKLGKTNIIEQFDCLQASIGNVKQLSTTISQDNNKHA